MGNKKRKQLIEREVEKGEKDIIRAFFGAIVHFLLNCRKNGSHGSTRAIVYGWAFQPKGKRQEELVVGEVNG